MKRRLLSFFLILTLLLPALVSGALLLAPREASNPFAAADRAREEALEESLGSAALSADGLPDGECAAGEGYIVRFASAMPLSEVYAAVEPFAYSLLSGSENRLFLLYLNDAEAFSQRYADKLLYMEKDAPRTVRTTGDVSDADSLPPSEEPSMPDAEAFTRWELAELGVYDALSVTDGSGVTVAVM